MKRDLMQGLDKIKKHLNSYIRDYEAQIKALENIEIVTKKDGKPFKNLNRNFANAEVRQGASYGWITLFVYYRDPEFGYATVDLYKVVGDEEYKEISENKDKYKGKLIDRGIYRQPIYQYSMEEIPQLIKDRIKQFKERLEKYKKEIELIEEKEEEIIEKFGEFDDYLKEIAGDTRLYDDIRDWRYL